MLDIVRTDSTNSDFIQLVELLDADLALRDGDEHDFYHQFNTIDSLNHAIVAYLDGKAVGCGAMKPFNTKSMEIKRMYVPPNNRGKGIASRILEALELWASKLGYTHCVLETGKRQPKAIALYKKYGYEPIPNYGQYAGVENSVCFEKNLIDQKL